MGSNFLQKRYHTKPMTSPSHLARHDRSVFKYPHLLTFDVLSSSFCITKYHITIVVAMPAIQFGTLFEMSNDVRKKE